MKKPDKPEFTFSCPWCDHISKVLKSVVTDGDVVVCTTCNTRVEINLKECGRRI